MMRRGRRWTEASITTCVLVLGLSGALISCAEEAAPVASPAADAAEPSTPQADTGGDPEDVKLPDLSEDVDTSDAGPDDAEVSGDALTPGDTMPSDAADSVDTTADDAAPETEDIPVYVEGENCDEAILVNVDELPFQLTASSKYANNDYSLGGGCDSGGDIGAQGRDVVFTLTAAVSGHHVFGLAPLTAIGNNPTVAYVIRDCEAPAESCVAVSGDLTSGGVFSALLEAGETYFVVVDGLLSEDAGRFTLVVQDAVCVPECPGPECGKDGCGGWCGEGCSEELACNIDGTCREPSELEGSTCPSAFEIDSLPFAVTSDTWYGAPELQVPAGSCGGGFGPVGDLSNDHIYRLDATVSGHYLITLLPEFDASMYIVTTCKNPAATCVAGSDESLTLEQMDVWLDEGVSYYIIIDGYTTTSNEQGRYTLQIGEPCVPDCLDKNCGDDGCGQSCGSCDAGQMCNLEQVCVAAPQGDQCGDPWLVDSMPYAHEADTTVLGNDFYYEASWCPGVDLGWGSASNDAIYQFTAPQSDMYSFAVEADFDTTLYVVSDCTDVATSCITGQDLSYANERIDLWLELGQSVHIIVDGYGNISNAAGPYRFTAEPTCIPQCENKECGPDACGSECGQCTGSAQCSPEGLCLELEGNSCAMPFVIDQVPFSGDGNTSDASNELGVPYDACPDETAVRGAGSKEEVWTITPESSGVYTFEVDAQFSASIYILTDCEKYAHSCFIPMEPGPLVWFQVTNACKNVGDSCEAITTEFTLDYSEATLHAYLEAGVSYFVVIDGQSNNFDSNGSYALEVSGPCTPQCDGRACGPDSCGLTCGECTLGELCNEEAGACYTQEGNTCEDAFVVDAANLPYTASGSTTDASNVYGVPKYGCPNQQERGGAGSNDEVYAFTPIEAGYYDIIVDTDHDHIAYVLTACDDYLSSCFYKETLGYNSWTANTPGCAFSAECLGASEGVGMGLINAELEAETTYYIVIDGRTGLTNTAGSYELEVRKACEPQCEGKQCGPDGCGQTCGECPGGFICTDEGLCIDAVDGQGDTCGDPHPVPTIPFIATGDTGVQSASYGGCGGGENVTKDEVWELVVEEAGVYQFNVWGDGNFEPSMMLVRDCLDTEYNCVASTIAQVMSPSLEAGVVYHVIIDAGPDGSAEGSYALEITKP